MKRVVPINDEEVPVPVGTLYQWHSKKVYPGLILKIKGSLYFDLDEWDKIVMHAKIQSLGGTSL